MKIYSEISLENFEAWSGAVNTLERIRSAGKCDFLESILEEAYPDGLSETGLNDILWFEPEWCYEMCGMRTESEIREELEEARERLSEIMEDYEGECLNLADMCEEEELHNGVYESKKQVLWHDNYADDHDEITEKIKELEEELEEI